MNATRGARRTLAGVACAALLVGATARAADKTPAWLTEAAAAGAPPQPAGVGACELLRECSVTVDAAGTRTTTERGVIKVLEGAGRDAASCQVVYVRDQSRVDAMHGWLLTPGGQVLRYGEKQSVDEQLVPQDVYNEMRVRLISVRDEAAPGAVFGYEWTRVDHPVCAQFDWAFQDQYPVRMSRLVLSLPPHWHAQTVTFNHAPLVPASEGSTQRWELTDLPALREEPLAPDAGGLVARLAVSLLPDDPARAGGVATFASWTDVSTWLTALCEPRARVDATVSSQARARVAAAHTGLDSVRAIGAFVQGVNYIAIQTGLGRGGGYLPHPANEVLRNGYGDCKDKANLMRVLLASVGMPAWLVAIYSGDPGRVREEWPSPQQFNHCILAVRAPAGVALAASIEHPTLGPLLVFDPTDPNTPLGDLPAHEQGSLALIEAGDRGGLVRMPSTPADSNRLRREVEVKLAADGALEGRLHERSTGSRASGERSFRRSVSTPDYARTIEHWIAHGVPGATTQRVAAGDDPLTGGFELEADFSSQRYGQAIGSSMLTFRPATVGRREVLVFSDSTRQYPIVLQSERTEETATFSLPAGFAVDELPPPARIVMDFGAYEAAYERREGSLRLHRTLALERATLPAARYAEVRRFFEGVRRAETAVVVLKRSE